MRRPILAILGFGTAAACVATVVLGWVVQPPVFERPTLRFHVSLSVAL